MFYVACTLCAAMPWIGMFLDEYLHGYNTRGPWSKFGSIFIFGSIIMLVIAILLGINEVGQ